MYTDGGGGAAVVVFMDMVVLLVMYAVVVVVTGYSVVTMNGMAGTYTSAVHMLSFIVNSAGRI